MTHDEEILRLVGQIYDAAGSPDKWATCLASICDVLHGTAAHVLHHDFRSHDGGISVTTLQDPAVIQAYYADFGRRSGLTRTLNGFLEASASTVSAALIVNRPDAGSEFGPEEARLIEILVPHLRRALVLHRRLTSIDAQRAAAADVIDRLTFGVILVDSNLRPVLVNQAAECLLAQRDGLACTAGGLGTGSDALTRSLRQMMVSAAAVTEGASFDVAAGTLRIPRPSGRRPLQVVVTPLASQNEYAGHSARAVVAVFIADPEHAITQSEGVLRRLYHLTPMEARVAIAVAEGHKVEQIAALLQLTRNTVRWYVKQALAKTGVSTQAQLVVAILSNPALVR